MEAQNQQRAKRCFVVSPVGDEGTEVRSRADKILRHLIRPACEACGMEAQRSDEIQAPGLITRRIVTELLRADCVVADLTGGNPNVYYEMAIRHAVGLPAVHIAEAGEALPFDVNQYCTVFVDHRDLDSVDKARAQLVAHIRSALAEECPQNPVTDVFSSFGVPLPLVPPSVLSPADRFAHLSEKLISELRRIEVERNSFLDKLFVLADEKGGRRTPPGQDGVPDFTGTWSGNHGLARIVQAGSDIEARYQFDTTEWIGRLSGRVVDSRILAQWREGTIHGIGYWTFDRTGEKLSGSWWYQHDAVPYDEVLHDPSILSHLDPEKATWWALCRERRSRTDFETDHRP